MSLAENSPSSLAEGDSVVEGVAGDLDYPAVIRSIGGIPLVDGRVVPASSE